MTQSKEASEIRSEVASLRKGPGRKYTKELRERVLAWFERALASGTREVECQEALGIPLQRLLKWREEALREAATVVPLPAVPRGTDSPAMMRVDIHDQLPFGPLIA